jgi:rhamnopyranosyl-N-acetylglucosaminyl-diphospho-decaprenol beta-1,3/1,4-galactofuranosyltransferase
VLAQTTPPEQVLVVDNASTDGTAELLRERFGATVDVLRLTANAGSSGGFHAGVAEGARRGAEWLWLMDDDTIPTASALGRLLAAREARGALPDPVLLASRVVWTDGRGHPMNAVEPDLRDMDRVLDAAQHGLVPVRSATFPSLLVRRDAVERHGPPREGFWISADDIDFTQRILRDEPGYAVPASVVVHKTRTAHTTETSGERFYFAARNGLFILRGDTLRAKEKVRWAMVLAEQVRRYLVHERFRPRALAVLLRGVRDGLLRGRP